MLSRGPHSWLHVPQPEGLPGIDGYAFELGLAVELPATIGQYTGWIAPAKLEALACRI